MSYLTQMEYTKRAQAYLGVLCCGGKLQEYLGQSDLGVPRELWALAVRLFLCSLYTCHAETVSEHAHCRQLDCQSQRQRRPPRNQEVVKLLQGQPSLPALSQGLHLIFPMTRTYMSHHQARTGFETTLPSCPQFLKYPSIISHPPCLHRPQPCLACPGQ